MNSTELNNELLEIRESIAERSRLSRELDRAERSLLDERQTLQRLSEILRKEDQDVQRLEGAGLVGLFYAVLGSKETRLDQERQELLAARLKYNSCQRRVTALERDMADLRKRLDRLGDAPALQARYEALLAEKERQVSADNSPTARRLLNLSTDLAGLRDADRELREAIQAGEQAQAGLDSAVALLESAGNWGTLDLFGGGMIVSAVKHSKLDEAHAAVQEVQPLLQRFERELADVSGLEGLQFETGGLSAFADIFMDNLLIDLLVQSRINDSLEAARGVQRQVSDLLARLKKNHVQTDKHMQALEAERRSLLEQG